MQYLARYAAASQVVGQGSSRAVLMQPNLARDEVAFDAAIRDPVRFREAISTLHDAVVSDLRVTKRDRAAYAEFQKRRSDEEHAVRTRAAAAERDRQLAEARQLPPLAPGVRDRFDVLRKRYWALRQDYSRHLLRHDRELWRLLMPCDPVVTVADDVVFFECFSADGSSYGCLTVDRDGFDPAAHVALGTTNVDYTWTLYDHFQSLRSYRHTRLTVDPGGFGVATDQAAGHREEKIDLPDGWLRGFLQVQSAMAMPTVQVSLSRDCVYSLLAFLKRHRAKTSPRALRFELRPGQPASLVLEPWEKRIDSRGTPSLGPEREPIRIWGVRRLLMLARLLPLVDRIDVHLLGTGLPSFWVARLGAMRLVIGLSGWTANDWTAGSPIDSLRPPVELTDQQIAAAAATMRQQRAIPRDALAAALGTDAATAMATADALAHRGQVIFDLVDDQYRWRSVMPAAIAESELGPPNPEVVASRQLLRKGKVRNREVIAEDRAVRIVGEVDRHVCEVTLSADRILSAGQCDCSHHFQNGIRRGPCRHLLALRDSGDTPTTLTQWYERLTRRSSN